MRIHARFESRQNLTDRSKMFKSAGGDSDQQDQKTAKMNYGFYDVVKLLGKGTYG